MCHFPIRILIWYEFAAYIAIDKTEMIFYNETTNCR